MKLNSNVTYRESLLKVLVFDLICDLGFSNHRVIDLVHKRWLKTEGGGNMLAMAQSWRIISYITEGK